MFGYHPRDDAAADHRDPQQWEFYVVATADLPKKNALSLRELRTLSLPFNMHTAAAEIEHVRLKLRKKDV